MSAKSDDTEIDLDPDLDPDLDLDFDLDLGCDEAVNDPHTYFRRLREHVPVFWNERHRAWIITRHADVGTALRGMQLTAERIAPFVGAVQRAQASGDVDATFEILADWLVFKDPPDHTRLRKLVAPSI